MICAIVLTRNRAWTLRKCLRSLRWCDEVLVLDDNSEDDTQAVVREFGNALHLLHALDEDFAQQHNFGLDQSKHEWTLFVDDDEMVSKELAQEIQDKISCSPQNQGFVLKRQDFFMGRKLQFGETSNVKLARLGRKGSGRWKRKVHEYWDLTEPLGELNFALEHHPHPTTREFLASINHYTTIDSIELLKEGKGFSLFRALGNPAAKFIQNYLFRLGCLDGSPGLVMAFMMCLHSLIVRVKQYELSQSS